MSPRLVFLAALVSTSVLGFRKRRTNSLTSPTFVNKRTPPRFVNQTNLPALADVDCSVYDDMMVSNIPVGRALGPVCRFWPSMGWGDFPLAYETVETVRFWLDEAFKPGGLWDRLKELWAERGRNSKFCWRATEMRPRTDTPPSCFDRFWYYHPVDMPGQDRTTEPTKYWCQKRCALTTGCAHFSYWTDSGCHLQNADSSSRFDLFAQNGPPVCPDSALVQVDSGAKDVVNASDDCDKVYFGSCYGTCPAKYQPSLLASHFAPVCTSVCSADPSHSVGCGFGCATAARHCFDVLMSQVTGVVDTVGRAAAYATGHVAVYEVVAELLQITEFIISSLWPMMQIAKDVWALWGEAQSVVGFLTVFLSYAMEKAAENGQSLPTLIARFQEVMGFWAALASEGITWETAPLEWLTRTLEEFGMETGDPGNEVDSVWGLIKAFAYPICKVD